MNNTLEKCNVCGERDNLTSKGSLTIQLDRLIEFNITNNLTWKIVNICSKCYPHIIETMNATYEQIVDEIIKQNERI